MSDFFSGVPGANMLRLADSSLVTCVNCPIVNTRYILLINQFKYDVERCFNLWYIKYKPKFVDKFKSF